MSEASKQQETSGWPGGWYIYENGKVEGPYAAADAFSRNAETSDGKQRLVSRKGFSQWYALKDLSEIFRMTESLGRKVEGAAELTETQILRFKADVSAGVAPTAAASAAVAPSPSAQPTPPAPRVKAKHIEGSLAKQVEAAITKPSRRLDAADDKRAAPAPAPTAAPRVAKPVIAGAAAAEAPRPTVAPIAKKAAKHSPQNQQLQEYFMVRGRLRLGKMRNPWISAFVGAPLSAGVYWAVWVATLSKEISWHSKQTQEKTSALGVMAMVPLFHFYAVFQLAKQMRDMEMQNKYATVSPVVACLFALFPPFALAYLQDAANRHWLLHVKYSIAKPKGGEEAA